VTVGSRRIFLDIRHSGQRCGQTSPGENFPHEDPVAVRSLSSLIMRPIKMIDSLHPLQESVQTEGSFRADNTVRRLEGY
jgi:hypothetical protein